jgi:transmembrane serine protease 9
VKNKMKLIIIFVIFASVSCEMNNIRNIADPFLSSKLDGIEIKPFIFGGGAANLNQFPYQAFLLVYVPRDTNVGCGGVLIKDKWVLTSAYCLNHSFTAITVFVGGINLLTDSFSMIQNVTAKSHIHVHPNYKRDTLENDIALIYVESAPEDLSKKSNTAAVKLPAENQETIGMMGTISGFGAVMNFGIISPILRYTILQIVNNTVCSEAYQVDVLKRDTNLCLATTNTSSPCAGDYGGPLTINVNDKTILVGILSFGSQQGCQSGFPVGFTKVSK